MRIAYRLWAALISLCVLLLIPTGREKEPDQAQPDQPRLTPNVLLRDVTFHSKALNREMQYRVLVPAKIAAGEKLPAVYLLHGGGGSFRNWSDWSDVAQFTEKNLVLVMPQGDSSYYVNSAERPEDRYEDYIVNDLISDVESRFPVAANRAHRTIVGVSMGGFGAIKLALSHPDLFAFAGGMSSAIDIPRHPYSIRRRDEWERTKPIFGDWGSQPRRDRDPFVLARSADPAAMPYLYLTCGEQEGLLAPNRQFAALLAQRHLQYEFHTTPGGHYWTQWNARLPELFQSLLLHIHSPGRAARTIA